MKAGKIEYVIQYDDEDDLDIEARLNGRRIGRALGDRKGTATWPGVDRRLVHDVRLVVASGSMPTPSVQQQ